MAERGPGGDVVGDLFQQQGAMVEVDVVVHGWLWWVRRAASVGALFPLENSPSTVRHAP